MSFNLYLVRHGQTYLNKYNRMQGWSDAPLTDKGITDGLAAGNRLANVKFDHVYSSDLSRAVHTAEYIMENNKATDTKLTPTQLPEFREQFFGSFEGLPSSELAADIKKRYNLDNVADYGDLMKAMTQEEVLDAIAAADVEGDAEDARAFWQRLEAGLKYLKDHTKDGENILVVAHGTLIRNLSGKYAGREYTYSSMYNGSISKWAIDDDQMKLEVFNDIEKVW